MSGPGEFLELARERRKLVMRSRCRLRRPDGERTWDPDTGTYADPAQTVIYDGICHFRTKSTASPAKRETDVGEAELVSEAYAVMLPFDAPRAEISDSVEIYESDDAAVIGRPLTVGWPEYGDNRTHRVLICFAHDRPQVNDA